MLTMYETDRPSTLINDTRWLLHFRSWSRVRSAMPNRELMRNGERNLEFFSSSFWPWKRVGKRGKRRILPEAGNRSVPTASFSSAYFTQERWLKVFILQFRIFGFSTSEIFRGFLRSCMGIYLASTWLAQANSLILRWGLSWFREVEKRGGWKELDIDQLARTATPRASESWQRVISSLVPI